jgi:hypothetical protein
MASARRNASSHERQRLATVEESAPWTSSTLARSSSTRSGERKDGPGTVSAKHPFNALGIHVIITRNGGDGPRIADERSEVAGFVERLMDQDPAR